MNLTTLIAEQKDLFSKTGIKVESFAANKDILYVQLNLKDLSVGDSVFLISPEKFTAWHTSSTIKLLEAIMEYENEQYRIEGFPQSQCAIYWRKAKLDTINNLTAAITELKQI